MNKKNIKSKAKNININEIYTDYLYSEIKDKLKSYYVNMNFSLFQDKVNDYFYNTGKEIKYIFIVDDDKTEILDKKILDEVDEKRRFELELLRYGFAYNKEDLKEYVQTKLYKQLQIEYELYYDVIKYNFYDKITFNQLEKGSYEITKVINGVTSIKKIEGNIKEKYSELVEILKNNNLNQYFSCIKNKSITLNYGNKGILNSLMKDNFEEELNEFCIKDYKYTKGKEKIPYHYESEQSIEDIEKRNNSKLTREEEIENKKELITKELEEEDLYTNKINYISYLEVHASKLERNKSQLDNIVNKDDSTFDKSGIILYGITLTGRKDFTKTTGPNPDFFRIGKNFHISYLRKIFRSKESMENLLDITGSSLNFNISGTSYLDSLLKDYIESSFSYDLDERLSNRLNNYMSLEIEAI